MDGLTSRVISFIRFPMMAAVVVIHCNIVLLHPELESRTLFSFLFLLTQKLAWVSLPIFFFISGLLFFKEGTFNITLYKTKLCKRIYTLLIPYILWNVLYFCIIAILQYFKPDVLLLLHKRIADFSLTDYLWIFWDVRQISHLADDQPTCLVGVFWFIQCLFLSILLSPVIYKLIQFTRHFFILLFFALCLIDYQMDIPGVNNMGIAYFCLGAYISIMHINLIGYLRRIPLWTVIAIILISLFSILIDNEYIAFFSSLLLQICVLSLVTYMIEYHHCHEYTLLTSSVFFIFAVHRLFTAPLMHISNNILNHIDNDILLFLYYLFIISIAILLSIAIFWIMNRYMPRITNVMSGNHSVIEQSSS